MIYSFTSGNWPFYAFLCRKTNCLFMGYTLNLLYFYSYFINVILMVKATCWFVRRICWIFGYWASSVSAGTAIRARIWRNFLRRWRCCSRTESKKIGLLNKTKKKGNSNGIIVHQTILNNIIFWKVIVERQFCLLILSAHYCIFTMRVIFVIMHHACLFTNIF